MNNEVNYKGRRHLGFLLLGVVLFFLGLPVPLWLFSIISELNAGFFRITLHGIFFLSGILLLGLRTDYRFSPVGISLRRVVWGKLINERLIAADSIKELSCNVFSKWQMEGGSRQSQSSIGLDVIKNNQTKEALYSFHFSYPKDANKAADFVKRIAEATGFKVVPSEQLEEYFSNDC